MMANRQRHGKVGKAKSCDGTCGHMSACDGSVIVCRPHVCTPPLRPASKVVAQDQIRGGLLVVASMRTVDGQGHRKLLCNSAARNKFKDKNVMAALKRLP